MEPETQRKKMKVEGEFKKLQKKQSQGVFIGTDCGATSTKIGGCYEDGSPISLDVNQFPTDAEQGPEKVILG